MARNEENAQMRAQLAAMELEQADVDETGQIVDKPYEAYRLKVKGLTYKEIAKRLGYSNEKAVSRAVQIYQEQTAASLSTQRREEVLNLAVERCETLIRHYWDSAMLGDLDAANYVLKAMQEEHRLFNLYEDKTTAVTNKYVVIAAERNTYASKLQEIAQSDTEQLAISVSSRDDHSAEQER